MSFELYHLVTESHDIIDASFLDLYYIQRSKLPIFTYEQLIGLDISSYSICFICVLVRMMDRLSYIFAVPMIKSSILSLNAVTCDPPCENGACVANDTCACSEGFTGNQCAQKCELYWNKHKYNKWKNHFSEMKGDVGMSLHEKEGEQEDAYTETGSH